MKKSIIKLNYFLLKKLEVQDLALSVIEIVERNNPETLKIKEIFDILVEQKPQIEALRIGYGRHRMTLRLNNLRRRRNALIQSFISQIRTLEKTKMSGTEEALIVVKQDVFHYLYGLPKESEETITRTVVQFFNFVEQDPELSAALRTLGLIEDLENLELVNADIDSLYIQRRENISARPKMKTREIVAALRSDIQDLFKQIEVAQIKNHELDYNPLIDELNADIAHYRAIIKTRASINKKKATGVLDDNEVVEIDNEVVIEDESGEPSESTETTQRTIPLRMEVADEEYSDQLDTKKTVAMSSKPMRLPSDASKA